MVNDQKFHISISHHKDGHDHSKHLDEPLLVPLTLQDGRGRATTWGSNIGVKHWGQTLGSNIGAKHWGQTLGSNIGVKHWGQTLGSNLGAKHWGQILGPNIGVKYTVSQELHQPKPFGTRDFISRVLLIHTYT